MRNPVSESHVDPNRGHTLNIHKIYIGQYNFPVTVLNMCWSSKKRWWRKSHPARMKNKRMSRNPINEITKSTIGDPPITQPDINNNS